MGAREFQLLGLLEYHQMDLWEWRPMDQRELMARGFALGG
jgi:hypothetical protein